MSTVVPSFPSNTIVVGIPASSSTGLWRDESYVISNNFREERVKPPPPPPGTLERFPVKIGFPSVQTSRGLFLFQIISGSTVC